jgi:replicative DNA helicase
MKHISTAYKEAIYYEEHLEFVKTRTKLDLALGGGLESNNLITIAGISGSGKSSLVNYIETELSATMSVLSFSLEMMAKNQVRRKLKFFNTKTKEQKAEAVSRMNESDVWYHEDPVSPMDIDRIAREFIESRSTENILIVIDHVLLLKGRDERESIGELQKVLIALRKLKKVIVIQVSQMNRNIETLERIKTPQFHYPQRSDIAAADTIYHASDVIVVVHRPELLGIISYGLSLMDTKGIIFLHTLKFREGIQSITRVDNKLDTQDWSY